MSFVSPAVKVKFTKGAYLYTETGGRIFDGISSWWLVTHGHSQKEIVDAINRQSTCLSQVVFADFTHQSAEELVVLLGEFLPPYLRHVFFSDNGSTAVEVAMKMAYQFARQSGQDHRVKFVAFEKAYHGDTCGAMSVSADGVFTKAYKDLRFEVLRSAQSMLVPGSTRDSVKEWISSFSRLMDKQGHEVCGVLIEPLLQGAGGMIVWPVEAVQEICDIARAHGALVIFDEVMTGFGRTGSLFAFEQVQRVPDILCLSKGVTGGFLPLGLTLASSSVYEAFFGSAEQTFFHGHSFTGNAISCAAAVANLKIFKKPGLFEKLSEIKNTHQRMLTQLANHHYVKEVRVCGTVGILEMSHPTVYGGMPSKQLQRKLLEKNIYLRPLGNVIYLMPPYCTEVSQIEEAWTVVTELLSSL